MTSINILGIGRLGMHLAIALQPFSRLHTLYARQLEQAEKMRHFCQVQRITDQINFIQPAEITFITVSDHNIGPVANHLAQHVDASGFPYVVHCSGILSSQHLAPLKNNGCQIASIHPFRPFTTHLPSNLEQFKPLDHCFCFVEGDAEPVARLTLLFKQCGAIVVPISAEEKPFCHLSAVIASNHLVTLTTFADKMLQQTGLSQEQRQHAILDITQQTLCNLSRVDSFADGLTGPLTRGDTGTIQQHLQCLTDPTQHGLYRLLSLQMLEQLAVEGEVKEAFTNILLAHNDTKGGQ